MPKDDLTFDPTSLYGSRAWVARRLGMSVDTFNKKRLDLEAEGFPRQDELLGKWAKADVDDWIRSRSTLKKVFRGKVSESDSTEGEDLGAFQASPVG